MTNYILMVAANGVFGGDFFYDVYSHMGWSGGAMVLG